MLLKSYEERGERKEERGERGDGGGERESGEVERRRGEYTWVLSTSVVNPPVNARFWTVSLGRA